MREKGRERPLARAPRDEAGRAAVDIAKLYRTTVEAILAANELKEESAAVIGKLLLIPRRR